MTALNMIRIRKLLTRRRPHVDHPSGSGWLFNAEQMRRILDRERMRSDRGNSRFSLLTFTFPQPCSPAQLADVERVLRKRLRATDDAGMLEPDRVGIVLPETPATGAWTLAEQLFRLLPASLRDNECDVYTYPMRPGTGRRTASRNSRPQPVAEPEPVAQPEPVAAGDGAVPLETTAERRVAQTARARSTTARGASMHAFFVQPLPAWKRAIDIVVAASALVFLAPLLLIVAAAVRLTSPGPAIFSQWRHTIGGRRFRVYKFRTMCVDAAAQKAALIPLSTQDGPAFKLPDDPRTTSVGQFLRTTSIDELPQLINVLLGQMSLVGPRPLPCDESRRCEPWQRRRLDVTAGLTCIWQVHGRSSVSFAEWMRMDLRYIRKMTLFDDLKLVAQTFVTVLLRRGAC